MAMHSVNLTRIRRQTGWVESGPPTSSTWLREHRVAEALEHRDAADLRLVERHNGADAAVELLPDGFHVLVLHRDAVLHEVGGVWSDGGLVDQHVDEHAAHRNPEVVEPLDESGDDGDGQRLGQGDEEK